MKKSSKKILIVEDNTLNLKLFRDILRAKGFETLEDRTGKHCLDLAIAHQPELVILDVMLPYASGIELTHQLFSHEKTSHIPILGVTALAISGTLDKMIESGCVDCLIKPFTLDQFMSSVEKTLQSSSVTNQQSRKIVKSPREGVKAEVNRKTFVDTKHVNTSDIDDTLAKTQRFNNNF